MRIHQKSLYGKLNKVFCTGCRTITNIYPVYVQDLKLLPTSVVSLMFINIFVFIGVLQSTPIDGHPEASTSYESG